MLAQIENFALRTETRRDIAGDVRPEAWALEPLDRTAEIRPPVAARRELGRSGDGAEVNHPLADRHDKVTRVHTLEERVELVELLLASGVA